MRFKLIVAALVLGFVGLVVLISLTNQKATNTDRVSSIIQIATDDETYDFGEISMQDGNVGHEYTVKNTSDQPIIVTKLHTSCMCTEVTMVTEGESIGPFGMEGHGGTVPNIELSFAPGQEAKITAVFDPAAHGSAGIGNIERSVFIDTSDGNRAELKFKAMVKP